MTDQGRLRLQRVCVAVLAAVCALSASAQAAKQGKKKPNPLKQRIFSSGPIALPIPDDPDGIGSNGAGVVQSQITISKRLRRLRIDDVNVSMRVSHTDTADLRVKLTAPNGATTQVVAGHAAGTGWGTGPGCDGIMFTVDDESPLFTNPDPTPLPGYDLPPPYEGSSSPPGKPLFLMDGGPIRGIWTLTVIDADGPGEVGTVDCWEVQITPRRSGASG